MRAKLLDRRLGAAALAAMMMSLVVAPAPALAQTECTCTLPASSGQLGKISTANSAVFLAGAAASAGAPLSSASVVTTGAAGRTAIDLGATCQFSMAGSMRMQIIPQQGQLCVQVVDDSLAAAVAADGNTAIIAGVAAGAGVVFSLGMLLAVSK